MPLKIRWSKVKSVKAQSLYLNNKVKKMSVLIRIYAMSDKKELIKLISLRWYAHYVARRKKKIQFIVIFLTKVS